MACTYLITSAFKVRAGFQLYRSLRKMSTAGKFLIDQPKYGFLKELGLESSNSGVYNGKWFANGVVR